jgi:hypothetical protein
MHIRQLAVVTATVIIKRLAISDLPSPLWDFNSSNKLRSGQQEDANIAVVIALQIQYVFSCLEEGYFVCRSTVAIAFRQQFALGSSIMIFLGSIILV